MNHQNLSTLNKSCGSDQYCSSGDPSGTDSDEEEIDAAGVCIIQRIIHGTSQNLHGLDITNPEGIKIRALIHTPVSSLKLATSRYGAILEARGVNLSELTATSEVDEPIELWLAATTGSTERPQRNRIVGFPTIPATQLLSNLAHRFRERSRGGASSSSSSGNRPIIPDQAFLQIVQTAVTNAQANPDQFGNLNNSEMEEVARNIIEVSDPARGSFNQVFFREVVNVVTTIFKSICNETQKAIDEANKDYTTDEEVGDGEGSSIGDENGSDGIGEDNDGSDDAGDVGGDNLRNDSASDK
ncbi:hypothetical protein POM88_008271 [Heracleum sosnowskyi]|uniref:Uncharacterized protein n=1 Tax=Heracleum sosnowskyi TaxID=360622 RepID=A0AAD8J6Y5_9APIA|nr:hypothetical protein POM88_008271 [Heracleum sosnowskyi]